MSASISSSKKRTNVGDAGQEGIRARLEKKEKIFTVHIYNTSTYHWSEPVRCTYNITDARIRLDAKKDEKGDIEFKINGLIIADFMQSQNLYRPAHSLYQVSVGTNVKELSVDTPLSELFTLVSDGGDIWILPLEQPMDDPNTRISPKPMIHEHYNIRYTWSAERVYAIEDIIPLKTKPKFTETELPMDRIFANALSDTNNLQLSGLPLPRLFCLQNTVEERKSESALLVAQPPEIRGSRKLSFHNGTVRLFGIYENKSVQFLDSANASADEDSMVIGVTRLPKPPAEEKAYTDWFLVRWYPNMSNPRFIARQLVRIEDATPIGNKIQWIPRAFLNFVGMRSEESYRAMILHNPGLENKTEADDDMIRLLRPDPTVVWRTKIFSFGSVTTEISEKTENEIQATFGSSVSSIITDNKAVFVDKFEPSSEMQFALCVFQGVTQNYKYFALGFLNVNEFYEQKANKTGLFSSAKEYIRSFFVPKKTNPGTKDPIALAKSKEIESASQLPSEIVSMISNKLGGNKQSHSTIYVAFSGRFPMAIRKIRIPKGWKRVNRDAEVIVVDPTTEKASKTVLHANPRAKLMTWNEFQSFI